MTNKLIEDLIKHTRPIASRIKNRNGFIEYHIPCPDCSHESSPKDPHCSFSEGGFHCFVCGLSCSLPTLAKKVGLESDQPFYNAPRTRLEPRRDTPGWLAISEHLCSRYERSTARFTAWQKYKPLSRETIVSNRLGYGVLRASQCPHNRLIVPILDGTMITGFRGRAIDCGCKKWLAPAGTNISLYPLYNVGALSTSKVVWIVENPVDALMVTEQTEYIGLGTYSVTYWNDWWLDTLRAARPELIIVAYDNDLPGNGGGVRRREFERKWLADPKHKLVPKANGIRLANYLCEAGLPATLYNWGHAEYKTDIGSLLSAAPAL